MRKQKVKLKVTATTEYEIDLDSSGYSECSTIEEAMEADRTAYVDEPYLVFEGVELKTDVTIEKVE